MKIMLEITRFASGVSNNNKLWTQVSGLDRNGRRVDAVCFDQMADTVKKTITKMIPDGAEVGSQRLLIDLAGEFRDGKQKVRDGKPVTRADGSPVLHRSFHIETFRLLTGPTLEMARMRRDADMRLTKAEKMSVAGDVNGAYRVLGEFVAGLCSRQFDLVEPKAAEIVADEDEEFGDVIGADAASAPATTTVDNPEAAAAEIFAKEDAVSEAALKPEASGPEKAHATEISVSEADVLDDAPVAEKSTEAAAATSAGPAPSNENVPADKPAAAPRRQGFGARRFAR